MGPKKGGGKKKKGAGEDEDTSTEDLWKFYRRKADAYGVPYYKPLKEKLDLVMDNGEELESVKIKFFI
jgi:hypothetical protein